MKILRTLAYVFTLVGGIVLTSANMTPVTFVYLPAFGLSPRPEGAQVEVPLALLLLASLVVGSLVAGTGTFVEHLRLRLAVRTQRRRNDKLAADLDKLRGDFEAARAAGEAQAAALASEQERTRRAQEAAAQTGAELARVRERAEQAERRALAVEQQGGVDSGTAPPHRAAP